MIRVCIMRVVYLTCCPVIKEGSWKFQLNEAKPHIGSLDRYKRKYFMYFAKRAPFWLAAARAEYNIRIGTLLIKNAANSRASFADLSTGLKYGLMKSTIRRINIFRDRDEHRKTVKNGYLTRLRNLAINRKKSGESEG